MRDWATCRFCKKTAHNSRMVKYGVRHYAHPACYLDHHDISLLMPWQIGQIPWRLLQDRGLLARAEALLKVERAR
jgi:hypothetical protein